MKFLITILTTCSILSSCSTMLDEVIEFEDSLRGTLYSVPEGVIEINNADYYVYSQHVTISINVTLADEMRFSNDGIAWTSWEPFINQIQWQIPIDTHGEKPIYAEFRNENGELATTDTIHFIERLTPANRYTGDGFGASVDISSDGNRIISGAYLDDGAHTGARDDQGAAYIFNFSGGDWTEKRITAGNAWPGAKFGWSVSLSSDGSTAIVGAYCHSYIELNRGTAYIFGKDKEGINNWGQVKELVFAGAAPNDKFGYCVKISGDGGTAACGAPYAVSSKGFVSVFRKDISGVNQWGQDGGNIVPADNAAGDNFGYSLSLSNDGNTLAVGAPEKYISGYASAGAVYIYKYEGAWLYKSTVTLSSVNTNDYFGSSVDLSADGTVLAAGARGRKIDTKERQGEIYRITILATGSIGSITSAGDTGGSSLDYLGSSICLAAGNLRIISSAPWSDRSGINRGIASMYDFSGGSPLIVNDFISHDSRADDLFGHSVRISGSGVLAVGSPYKDTDAADSGAVYIFRGN